MIQKIDNSKIVIELRWYRDYATEYFIESDKFELIYKGETTLKSFISNSFNSIKKILDENGIGEYKEKWRHEFPLSDYKTLTELKRKSAQQLI